MGEESIATANGAAAGTVCCSVLQRVAACCSILQCVESKNMEPLHVLRVVVWCSEVQHGAVCCSVFQCVAVCRIQGDGVAASTACCSAVQCVAVCRD